MKMHHVDMFPEYFKYYGGTLHFVLDEISKGLSFSPEPYAPILQYTTGGRLQYKNVTPYNLEWLRKDQFGNPLPEEERVSFEPAIVWLEDRWIFVRRMAGDELSQILFYKLRTFIWRSNQIEGRLMHEHQDALISTIFGYEDEQEFLDKQDQAMTVTTWDGKDRALISTDYIHKMFKEICMLGPLAGVYGREVQILMQTEAPD